MRTISYCEGLSTWEHLSTVFSFRRGGARGVSVSVTSASFSILYGLSLFDYIERPYFGGTITKKAERTTPLSSYAHGRSSYFMFTVGRGRFRFCSIPMCPPTVESHTVPNHPVRAVLRTVLDPTGT